MTDIKNRAFKMWLAHGSELDKAVITNAIKSMLSEQQPMAFDLMEEAGFEVFTEESFEKTAEMVLEQVNQQGNED